jgi:hypothetical protein
MTVVVKLLREAAPMTMKFVRSESAHTVGKLSRCFIWFSMRVSAHQCARVHLRVSPNEWSVTCE